MKRLLVGLSVLISVWMLSPTPDADARRTRGMRGHGHHSQHMRTSHHKRAGFGVPELDPGVAGSAIVLLLGGAAFIASRRREEDLA